MQFTSYGIYSEWELKPKEALKYPWMFTYDCQVDFMLGVLLCVLL